MVDSDGEEVVETQESLTAHVPVPSQEEVSIVGQCHLVSDNMYHCVYVHLCVCTLVCMYTCVIMTVYVEFIFLFHVILG